MQFGVVWASGEPEPPGIALAVCYRAACLRLRRPPPAHIGRLKPEISVHHYDVLVATVKPIWISAKGLKHKLDPKVGKTVCGLTFKEPYPDCNRADPMCKSCIAR